MGITECLHNLLGPELAALDTCLVDTDVLEQCNLFTAREPLGFHGCIRKKDKCGQADGDSDKAKGDEHDPPAGQRSSWADVLESITYETTNNLTQTQSEIPERESGSLLRLGVPLAADQHEGGSDGRFKYS